MNMKVVLSIKPEFVDKILSGKKKYEYRKRIFKQEVDSVVIYSTKPVGMFIGEFKVEKILYDSVDEIWESTNDFSGISYDYFMKYFNSQKMAYALQIKDLKVYSKPLRPQEVAPNFKAPQSFCYLK